MLDQAGEAGAGHVDRRARALWLRTVFAKRSRIALRVHVPVLPVLAIIVHGEGCSVSAGRIASLRASTFEIAAAFPGACRPRATLGTSLNVGNPEKGGAQCTSRLWDRPVRQIHMYHGMKCNCTP